jgi:hypothetical protein
MTFRMTDRTNDKEVVVPPRRRLAGPECMRPRLLPFVVLLFCVSGCAAMIQDVHLYYQQMADNYKEAEEKATLDAATLERESGSLLMGGELHKYKRAQREVARIRNWQEYCDRQRARFQNAADKTARTADDKSTSTADDKTAGTPEDTKDADQESHSEPR